MFIPPEKTAGRSHALFTIQDQISQISRSYAAESLVVGVGVAAEEDDQQTLLIIYYNTIGSPTNPSDAVNEICDKVGGRSTNRNGGGSGGSGGSRSKRRIQCIHMNHYESDTFEEVTLTRSREYCQKYPNHTIIYVHNKGAYHPSPKNTRWRRYMTAAVTGKHCLQSVTTTAMTTTSQQESTTQQQQQQQQQPESSCNICGLVATAIPWIHFTGNFFTARCSYIKELLPPETYVKELETNVVPIIHRMKTQGKLTFGMFPYDDAYIGLGRFSNEHWPCSHPSVQLCDVTGNTTIIDWKTNNHPIPTNDFTWSLFPHSNEEQLPIGKNNNAKRKNNNKNQQKKRLREYYHMAGNMLKWITLYNQIPNDSSWVWKYYPEGQTWKEGYTKYGNMTLDELLL